MKTDSKKASKPEQPILPLPKSNETSADYYNRVRNMWLEFNLQHEYFGEISAYVETHPEYTKEQVLQHCREDIMFAKALVKDPVKQSCAEKCAFKYLSTRATIMSGKDLPNSGPNAVYVYNNRVGTKGTIGCDIPKAVKSIDFIFEAIPTVDKKYTIYVSHKRVEKWGGNQSHQSDDMITYVTEACKFVVANPTSNARFLAIGDGKFFERKLSNGLTNREYISKVIAENGGGIKVRFITSDEFEDYVRSL